MLLELGRWSELLLRQVLGAVERKQLGQGGCDGLRGKWLLLLKLLGLNERERVDAKPDEELVQIEGGQYGGRGHVMAVGLVGADVGAGDHIDMAIVQGLLGRHRRAGLLFVFP